MAQDQRTMSTHSAHGHRPHSPGDLTTIVNEEENAWNEESGGEHWAHDDVEAFRVMMDEQSTNGPDDPSGCSPCAMISDVISQFYDSVNVSDARTPQPPPTSPRQLRPVARALPHGQGPHSILTPPRNTRTKSISSRARGRVVRWQDVEDYEQRGDFLGWSCIPMDPGPPSFNPPIQQDIVSELREESFYKEPQYFMDAPHHPTQVDGENDPILSFRERKLSQKAKAKRLAAASWSGSEDDSITDFEEDCRDDDARANTTDMYSEAFTSQARARSPPIDPHDADSPPQPQYAEIVWKSQHDDAQQKRGIFGSKGKKSKGRQVEREVPRSRSLTRRRSNRSEKALYGA